ncbi:MAG: hypothetical protein ACM3SW_09890, partial [Actinomycetota bacterium]
TPAAVLWIVLGAWWLRRAWVGAKRPLLNTLVHSKGEPDSSGVRLGNAVLGIANIVLGTVYLLSLLFKSGHLR